MRLELPNCAPTPIIQPISHYGKKRKAHQRRYVVYLIGKEGTDARKVGRTSNLQRRMADYRAQFGSDIMCLAQIDVPSLQDAKLLEREFVEHIASTCPREGREWFRLADYAIPSLVKLVVSASKADIDAVRGAGRNEKKKVDHVQSESAHMNYRMRVRRR